MHLPFSACSFSDSSFSALTASALREQWKKSEREREREREREAVGRQEEFLFMNRGRESFPFDLYPPPVTLYTVGSVQPWLYVHCCIIYVMYSAPGSRENFLQAINVNESPQPCCGLVPIGTIPRSFASRESRLLLFTFNVCR